MQIFYMLTLQMESFDNQMQRKKFKNSVIKILFFNSKAGKILPRV